MSNCYFCRFKRSYNRADFNRDREYTLRCPECGRECVIEKSPSELRYESDCNSLAHQLHEEYKRYGSEF